MSLEKSACCFSPPSLFVLSLFPIHSLLKAVASAPFSILPRELTSAVLRTSYLQGSRIGKRWRLLLPTPSCPARGLRSTLRLPKRSESLRTLSLTSSKIEVSDSGLTSFSLHCQDPLPLPLSQSPPLTVWGFNIC